MDQNQNQNLDHFQHIPELDYTPIQWLRLMHQNYVASAFHEREYTLSFFPLYLESWIQVFHKLQHDIFDDDYNMEFEEGEEFEEGDNSNPFNNYLYLWFHAVLYQLKTHCQESTPTNIQLVYQNTI
jgi:hypothetical protein